MYIRKHRFWEKDCIVVIKASQLTDAHVVITEDIITAVLGKQSHIINIIAIICVDSITPAFKNYIGIPAVQEIKNGRFLSGISFDKKTVYISNNYGKMGIFRYKRLKQLFLSAINTGSTA